MNVMMKLVLIFLYPLLILTRVANAVFGRDPLHLREPKMGSFWLSRSEEAGSAAYFSESSRQSDEQSGGLTGIANRALRWVARWFAPSHPAPNEKYSAAADRERGIPDEIYTLW